MSQLSLRSLTSTSQIPAEQCDDRAKWLNFYFPLFATWNLNLADVVQVQCPKTKTLLRTTIRWYVALLRAPAAFLWFHQYNEQHNKTKSHVRNGLGTLMSGSCGKSGAARGYCAQCKLNAMQAATWLWKSNFMKKNIESMQLDNGMKHKLFGEKRGKNEMK